VRRRMQARSDLQRKGIQAAQVRSAPLIGGQGDQPGRKANSDLGPDSSVLKGTDGTLRLSAEQNRRGTTTQSAGSVLVVLR